MSVGDLARPDRYIEVRGEVVGFALFETLAWVNQLHARTRVPTSPGERMVSSGPR
jgi:hypothetical protein